MASVWGELKRRNVVRVAIAYAIASWLILQLANILIPLLTLPEWVERLVLLIVLIGFPLALFFAWAFEMTPEGIKKEKDVVRSESVTHLTGRKLDFIIIGVLAAALLFFMADKYGLGPGANPQTETASEVSSAGLRRSIAVLPFVNMSSDPEQEYFSDGLSEEILNLLAKVPDLKVIGRTSSFAFKGKNEDLRLIGQALDVTTVLEGSVRKSGDRVRITAQLIDVADGAHLWSETYDRTLTDVFAVQDDVAAEILGALQIHVGSAPSRGRPTENTDAYAQFLKAKAAMNRWEAESAEEFLLQAVELDPNFAEAWEMLAYAYWERWGNTMDAVTAQPLMSNAAIKALAIDPELELARVFLNTAESEATWVLREIEELERILSVDPNNAVAVEILIWDLQFAGYFEESLHISERAVERDPLSPNAQFNLFSALNMTGRDSEALATLELADELNANTAKLSLALFHHLAQRFDLAIEYHEAYLKERKLPYGWVQDLHLGAIDPETGQAHLDRRIPEILASVPEDRTFEMKLELSVWYLTYGFLDRYFELIFQSDTPEILVANGIFGRDSGFIAHPRFIEIAEAMVLVDLWDKRGPPDFCEKVDGEWVCE